MTDFTLGTVMSSRIRLARNINGYPFPGRLKSDRQAKEIIRSVSAAIDKVGEFRLYYMDGISEDEALNFVENRLISPALLSAPTHSAVLVCDSDGVSVMVNEEDHLREQCICSGLALREAYEKLSDMDTQISRSLPFAYDEKLGYLTACPTNLGTGLRASVMMFLPALQIGGMISDVIKSVTNLGLTVRGAYGEGSSAEGYVFQVSNEVTLGYSEEYIISQVESVASTIVEMESKERKSLLSSANSSVLKDKCLRAYGILTNCVLLSCDELDDLCTYVKLGACLGYLKATDISAIDELMLKMKPSNLNVLAGRKLDVHERDEYRAYYVSKELRNLVNR